MSYQGYVIIMASLTPLISAMFLFYKSMFISIEMPFLLMMNFNFKISILIDWLSSMFLFTVMMISGMILIFSTNYIPLNEQKQFNLLLLMFVMSMMILILSNNIVFMLLGWDGLGLSSYILVIYYQDSKSAASGTITVLSNRVGDIMILLSISMLAMITNWEFIMNESFSTIAMMLISIAACTKSAQFPFSAWLPAAMAAPTPISALVHSSTLVTAGVYMMIRVLNFNHPISMMVILILSSMTMLYASMSACWEQDMKKIIALSTLSQIAMMMFSLAIGMTNLAFLHLIIHAMFKSMMFMCAGIMIHNSSYQDMRHMSFIMKNSPIPPTILGTASMALMGLPFMSGFFSKDLIMESFFDMNIYPPLMYLMAASIGMTATYSIRLLKFSMNIYLKTKPDKNLHTLNFMEIPIILMAPISVSIGAIMIWMTFPNQMFILPPKQKMMIMTLIALGMMTSLIFNFNKKKYNKLGESAISLWFIHYMSSLQTLKLYPTMNYSLKMDKTWQENYGPLLISIFLTKTSMWNTKNMLSLMFILMMMTIIPTFSIMII